MYVATNNASIIRTYVKWLQLTVVLVTIAQHLIDSYRNNC